LVTVLTASMILGIITIVALLVIRLNSDPARGLILPREFDLPGAVTITGITWTGTVAVIVTDDNVLRVFDLDTRALLQEIDLDAL